jgi:hypothetical protein
MATVLVAVEEYLMTIYQDGDRDFLDCVVVEQPIE